MGSFRFFTVLSAAVLALALPLVIRDAVTVENDITQKIAPQATTLANAVNGFPASGLVGALVCLFHSHIGRGKQPFRVYIQTRRVLLPP